jgi:predicted CxxxxCH...CXXCH cytochrome family protein
VADGRPAATPSASGEQAPLLRVLGDAIHAPLVTAGERATFAAWIEAGAPKFRGSVHEPSFIDPRSPKSHGRALREKRWRPMLDAKDPEACGRCHEGVPRPEKITETALGAPACTTCHAEERGVLACGTCHVDGPKSFPPRDACFFPDDPMRATAHAKHDGPSASRALGLACGTCHAMPPPEVIGGAHGNGKVEVAFDPTLAGPSTWDDTSRTCMAACHAREGGAKPRPAWTDKGPLTCSDCHSSPPPKHFAGACSGCHAEANATGTALTSPRLHVNAKVDLGDGSGKCGACHGKGDDPWPSTGAHAKHRSPASAASVECATCHTVPTAFGPGTGHPRGGAATVKLAGLALARNAPATFANGTCQNVYCHGQNLEGTTARMPAWNDATGAEAKCGSCHGLPPSAPHISNPKCDLCHGTVDMTAAGPTISPSKRALHIDGNVDR